MCVCASREESPFTFTVHSTLFYSILSQANLAKKWREERGGEEEEDQDKEVEEEEIIAFLIIGGEERRIEIERCLCDL